MGHRLSWNRLLMAALIPILQIVSAQPQPGLPAFDLSIFSCLQSKGFSFGATFTITDQDLQCYAKYLWLWSGMTGTTFTNTFSSNASDFSDVYSYNEPSLAKIEIDQSCMMGVLGSMPFYYPVLWNCLEYCSNLCKPSKKSLDYPVKYVSCKSVGETGCNEKRVCSCKNLNNAACGADKTFIFGDSLSAYKDQCLNCYFKKYGPATRSRSTCIRGTETHSQNPKVAYQIMKKQFSG